MQIVHRLTSAAFICNLEKNNHLLISSLIFLCYCTDIKFNQTHRNLCNKKATYISSYLRFYFPLNCYCMKFTSLFTVLKISHARAC